MLPDSVQTQLANQLTGILYASVALSGDKGAELLKKAVGALLSSIDASPVPSILWSAQYQQRPSSGAEALRENNDPRVIRFNPVPIDLAFDDTILENNVQAAWQKILGDEAEEFLVFQDREAYTDDDE